MSTPQNNGTIKLTRGVATKLGAISATLTQNVQFVIPEPTRDNQGFLIVQGSGNITTPTAILEGSLDGGNTWFSLTTSTNIVLGLSPLLTGDPAAGSADAFQVSGMGGGVLFRFGYTAGTITGSITIWAVVG